ncbi:MAG: heme exporter protein CcmD [Burkholderiaceae bacterium]
MNWQSASEFWSMRGYGLYVWGSYAMTLALMLFEAASVRRGRRAAQRAAARPADPSQADA